MILDKGQNNTPSILINKASLFYVFSLTKNYSKYMKIIDIKLASSESVFKYEYNGTNYVEYNQDIFAQSFGQSSSWNACAPYLSKPM